MMWHFIPTRTKTKNGSWIYTVQESFGKYGHTAKKEGISPLGENKKELIQNLEWMLNDLKKYPTKTIKFKEGLNIKKGGVHDS